MAEQHDASDLFRAAAARTVAGTLPVFELISEAAALAALGRVDLTAELYKLWIAYNGADPHLFAVYFNYGTCLQGAGDLPGAINALREGIRLKPDFHPAHVNLGRALEDSGQVDAAVTQWTAFADGLPGVTGQAVATKVMALQQIGRVLEDRGEDARAEDALRRSLDLDPAQPEAAQHWVSLRQRQCRWPAVEGWDRMSRDALLEAISPLSLANISDDPLFLLASAERYGRKLVGRPARLPGVARGSAAGAGRSGLPESDKLRIGYVSSDLREHAVGFAMTDVFESHDRARVEVHAYYCGIARDDATKRRIRGAVDRWTDIDALDDAAAARAVAADGIDILVDLNGYTKSARTGVFARRPAPVAVNWFGFPGSMGSPHHHYLIADPYVVPEGAEPFYAERVLRLPCYQPNDRRRAVSPHRPSRADEGLPEEATVFCCLNGPQKITEAVFARWMEILRRVPGSALWLLSGGGDTDERLRARAAALGVDPERLVFAAKRANPDHLARYPLADLFLDTFPYGAHTTAADALWMGVPVLTMSGRSFASRVCGSVVSAAGLADTIADTPEDYVARAVALGRDPAALRALRRRAAAARDGSPLFDTPRLVAALEGLYRGMWAEFEAGRRPVPNLDGLDVYRAIGLALHGGGRAEDAEDAERLSDGDYLARYRAALAERHDAHPLRPDGRLWTEADAARRPA